MANHQTHVTLFPQHKDQLSAFGDGPCSKQHRDYFRHNWKWQSPFGFGFC